MNAIRTISFLLLSTLLAFADSNKVAEDTNWTHSWEQGEDATSSFYYFIGPKGGDTCVRMLWNGGAQNDPTITDFYLGGSKLRVVKSKGDRQALKDLMLGRDKSLEVVSEYELACKHAGEMLAPPAPDKSLTDQQRLDLYNLILILAENRAPYIQKNKSP